MFDYSKTCYIVPSRKKVRNRCPQGEDMNSRYIYNKYSIRKSGDIGNKVRYFCHNYSLR